MNKVLTTIGKGAGALLPILLVVSIGFDLYDRYQAHKQTTTIKTSEPEEEAVTGNE